MRAASMTVLAALGLSLVAVVVFGLVVPAPAAAPVSAATARVPQQLVVALHLPAPGLQVGAIRAGEVVAAQGFEVDVARALAARIGAESIRFRHVADAAALTASGPKTWDLALAALPEGEVRGVALSRPYLRTDPVVVARPRGTPVARRAELRELLLCVVDGSLGAREARALRPRRPPVVARSDEELARMLETGRCDAGVREAPYLGLTLRRLGTRHGPLAGRLARGPGWAVALPRNTLLQAKVDRALRSLEEDGTLGRLAVRWLGFDPAALPRLR